MTSMILAAAFSFGEVKVELALRRWGSASTERKRLRRQTPTRARAVRATCLSQRWSFNGDWADSAGGAQSSATACGTYVSLYGNRVHMGYGGCSHGTGYVNLGTNMLDTTAATIEIWARHDGVENWSRVFDYGKDLTSRGYSWPITTASSATTEYSAAIL